MSLLGTLLLFGKEMLPFLKESLLEGQSLKTWLRDNWLTFFSLLSTLFLTMMVAHLSDLIHDARHREIELRRQIHALALPARQLMDSHQHYKHKARSLEAENAELRSLIEEGTDTIDLYLDWMRNCGVNVNSGQCPTRTVRPQPTRPPRRTAPPTPAEDYVNPEEEERGFLRRVRDILNRQDASEDDEP